MKILVTGGEGFIGTPLVEKLKADNEVVIYKGDILDRINLAYAFGCKPDVVLHLAAPNTLDAFKNNPTMVTDVIVGGTRDIAKLCQSYNIRLVYASSINVEQISSKHSVQSCYTVSKLMAETIIQDILDDYLILRIPAVYGEGMKEDRLLAKILNGTFVMNELNKDNLITYKMLPEFIEETLRVFNAKGIYHYETELHSIEELYNLFTE